MLYSTFSFIHLSVEISSFIGRHHFCHLTVVPCITNSRQQDITWPQLYQNYGLLLKARNGKAKSEGAFQARPTWSDIKPVSEPNLVKAHQWISVFKYTHHVFPLKMMRQSFSTWRINSMVLSSGIVMSLMSFFNLVPRLLLPIRS